MSVLRRGLSYIGVSNLKRIALCVQKLLGGPKISNSSRVTPATPNWRSIWDLYAGWSLMHMCAKVEAGSFICSKEIRGVPKFEFGDGRWYGPPLLRGFGTNPTL